MYCDRMGVFRSTAEQQAKGQGIDGSRLPPGQYVTTKWPVLHAGSIPPTPDFSRWTFTVFGEVENPIELSFDELRALPASELRCDIHCVTRWSRFEMPWKGVSFREIVKLVRPSPAAQHVISHAEGGYTANVPLSVMDDDDVLVAYEADGAPLTAEHGYPLRLLVPKRYFWKSSKWLRGLEFSSIDKPGFWEGYGYSNNAEPFAEERYEF